MFTWMWDRAAGYGRGCKRGDGVGPIFPLVKSFTMVSMSLLMSNHQTKPLRCYLTLTALR